MTDYIDNSYRDGLRDTLKDTRDAASANYVGREKSIEVRSISFEQIAKEPAFQRRVGLLKGRVFEQMQGLTAQTRSDLSDTLARGMMNGRGIREIKRDIRKRIKVSSGRAEKIARTEINNAYRTANKEETEVLNERLFKDDEFEMRMLWHSALASTTRPSHARRHGRTYTTDEVDAFYYRDGNAINCLCSQTAVLVWKRDGSLVSPSLAESMKKQRQDAQRS